MRRWVLGLLAGAAIALMVALVIGYMILASAMHSLGGAFAAAIGELLLVQLAVCAGIEIAVSLLFRLR